MNVSVFRTLGKSWIVIPNLPSWVHYRSTGPIFDAVFLHITSHVHIVPNFLPRSLCGWPCKSLNLLVEGHNQLIVHFAYPCHVIGKEFVFLFFLYIKLVQLGVKVAFNNRSTVTHHESNLLAFPHSEQLLWPYWACLCAAHLLLLHSTPGTPRPCLSTVWIPKYIRSADWLRPWPHLAPAPGTI